MAEAHLFVIMGTETYGKKTSGKIDTWMEMQEIKQSGKPFFLINMNPDSSMMRFKEDLTNQLFDLDTVAWHRWAVGKPMSPKLPGSIMEKLAEGADRAVSGFLGPVLGSRPASATSASTATAGEGTADAETHTTHARSSGALRGQ